MKLIQSPAFWIPLIVLLAAGVLLFIRSRGERPWGFKDVVQDPGYWDRAAEARKKAEDATSLAKEWDDATVNAAVTTYLFEATSSRDAWVEKKQLEGLGSRTHPRVLELLAEPGRYSKWVTPTGKDVLPEAPFHRACDLLGDTPPSESIPLLAPFLDDPDKSIRQAAALALGKTGSLAMAPLLKRALGDPEKGVRGYALMGLEWAVETGTLSTEAAQALFDDVRQLVEKQENGDRSAEVLFAFDPKRAEEVFLSPSVFHPDSRILHEALEAMADSHVSVDRDRLLPLIDSICREKIEYPREYLLGQALRLLGRHRHPDDRKRLESLQKHRDEDVAAGASQGILAWHGVEGFEKRVWEREEKEGYDSLTRPQRHYSAVFMLDAEIKNGGLDQYFVNSSGDQWRDAMEGLKAMKAGKHLSVLQKAVAKFGKDGPSADRAIRQMQLAKIASADEAGFDALNDRYYDIEESIEVIASRYALENSGDFR